MKTSTIWRPSTLLLCQRVSIRCPHRGTLCRTYTRVTTDANPIIISIATSGKFRQGVHTESYPGKYSATIVTLLPQPETAEQDSHENKETSARENKGCKDIAILEMAPLQRDSLIPRRGGRGGIPARGTIACGRHDTSQRTQVAKIWRNIKGASMVLSMAYVIFEEGASFE